jgi:hypothetical protein
MEIKFVKSLKTKFQGAIGDPRVRKIAIPLLGIGFFLQIYFLRELLAAELLFGLAFAVLLSLGGIFYIVGALGERGLDWADVALRAIGRSTRRGYVAVEELSKKSFRHHPESAR